MLFSVMLWMPSWGGMLNGLLTLRGAWQKVSADPVLKFFVVGVTFYGMATFEGPLLSIKSVNALSHYTDWTIAHVHAGALGWVGFMTFGMLYWMMPRVCQSELWSKKLATTHFWIATVGLVLYIVPIYVAGITQGTMWRAIDDGGKLVYPEFIETLAAVIPMYVLRVLGGSLYLFGAVLAFVNLLATWARRPAHYEIVVHRVAALVPQFRDPPLPESRLKGGAVVELAHKIDVWQQAAWHRRLERLPLRFTLYMTLAVIVASLFEIVPTFLIRSNVPTIQSVRPYTPLEVAGRDLYIGEGCYNCHSQMIRPILAETKRYGEFSKPGEFVYDHPFQWGSRRIGPDLAREGGRQSSVWQVLHLQNPRQINDRSIMPAYPWMLTTELDFASVPARLRALSRVGVPYDEATISGGAELARKQAVDVAKQIVDQKGQEGLDSKQVVAVVAYLQRLGKDLYAAPAAAAATPAKVEARVGGQP